MVQAVRAILDRASTELGLDVYAFSVFHVFFEQYLTIGAAAARLLALAGAAVSVTVGAFTGSAWAAVITAGVLASLLVDLLAVMVLWGVQLNAVRLSGSEATALAAESCLGCLSKGSHASLVTLLFACHSKWWVCHTAARWCWYVCRAVPGSVSQSLSQSCMCPNAIPNPNPSPARAAQALYALLVAARKPPSHVAGPRHVTPYPDPATRAGVAGEPGHGAGHWRGVLRACASRVPGRAGAQPPGARRRRAARRGCQRAQRHHAHQARRCARRA